MDFEFRIVLDYLPDFLAGAVHSIELTLTSLAVGVVLGLGLALARLSKVRLLSWPAYAYIEFFRTTPPLIQIVWFYFVVPVLLGIDINSFEAAAAALGLNGAAFLAEIFRAGIQGIDVTQRDAAQVLGLSRFDTYRYIILPQAMRIVLPPTTTTMMLLMKGTSLASVIGALELTRVGQLTALDSFRPMEVWTVVALFYFVMTYPISLGARYLERRLRVGEA